MGLILALDLGAGKIHSTRFLVRFLILKFKRLWKFRDDILNLMTCRKK